MPIPLPSYIKIKDKFCIAYFGNSTEYLIQLKLVRPFIEQTFPGLQIYIACKNDISHLLDGEKNVVLQSELLEKNFGYVKHLVCNMSTHPLEDLLADSEITINSYHPTPKTSVDKHKCVLLTNGTVPTKSLTEEQTNKLVNKYKSMGYKVFLNENYDNAGLVVGVESENLYKAASEGYRTVLVSTGLGTKLFKKLFPENEVIDHI